MMETYNINDSSRITKVVFYDNRDVVITFKNGKVYRYAYLSEFDFNTFKDDIENGLSVGKSFERRIRNKYAGQKL